MAKGANRWIWGNRNPESWQIYQESARARGEDLGIEAWLPPEVPDDDNLFRHFWMVSLFRGRAKELVQALAHPRSPEFAVVHEMAARPSAWANVDFDAPNPTAAEAWSSLSGLGSMLWNRAAGALYSGEEATAVADLEALLRLGAHLRGQHFLLSQLTGAHMEIRALRVIETGARTKAFSPESRQRLRAARRSRNLEEEIASTLRVERGLCLKHLESFPKRPPRGLRERLSSNFYKPEQLVAANSLFLCEKLDRALSPTPSVAGFHRFKRWTSLNRCRAIPGSPLAMACKMLSTIGVVTGSLLAQEKEAERVFKLLRP